MMSKATTNIYSLIKKVRDRDASLQRAFAPTLVNHLHAATAHRSKRIHIEQCRNRNMSLHIVGRAKCSEAHDLS